MSDKLSTFRECHMGEEGHMSWRVLFRRVLCQYEEYEFVSLLSLLSNVFICGYSHLEALPFLRVFFKVLL